MSDCKVFLFLIINLHQIMKTKFLLVILFSFSQSLFSQNTFFENYPQNRNPYIGGYEGYYKDFHNIIQEKNLQPCNNPNEIYVLKVVILPDSSIQFVKELNEKIINSNKCAYNLAREVAKYQKNWNPVIIDGTKQTSVANFIIFPDDFFNNYRDGYFPNYTPPKYVDKKTGVERNYEKDFVMKFNKKRFRWNDVFVIQGEFTVTKEGKVKDIFLPRPSGLDEFDKEIKNTINILSKNMRPATINGTPIDDRFSFMVYGSTEVEYN